MATLNTDFRGADEIIVPDLNTHTGYAPRNADEKDVLEFEKRFADEVQAENPLIFESSVQSPEPDERIVAKWNEFQRSKGRYEGSADWSLLDEFCLKIALLWLPQIIGSCVLSNTFRAYVIRMMYQIFFLGQSQELLGKDEFGVNNLAPYGPFQYGLARQKANMRGGDGLYCEPMAWALAQGVLRCSNQKLIQITRAAGVGDDRDYPEPQGSDGAAFYRAMGNWKHIDELKPEMEAPVLEGPAVTTGDQLWDLLGECKPSYVCSMEAIRKVGEHPDGFAIHARDPGDRWAHNMAFHGRFVASDGERIIRESNESWGKLHIYNRRLSEVDKSFKEGRLTVRAIGAIDAPGSKAPTIL